MKINNNKNTLVIFYVWAGLILSILLVLPILSASDGVFKQDTNISLVQSCNNCTYCNISKIIGPESGILLMNLEMTKDETSYNYTLSEIYVDSIGKYCWFYDCGNDLDKATGKICFDITSNGKPEPTGSVVVLFIIFFLILVGSVCYLSIYTIGHLMSLDFDIKDLALDWGIFFMIVTLFYLEEYYLGNAGFRNYLLWFMSIGGILLVLIPIIAFIMSMIIGTLNKRKFTAQPPRKWRIR